MVPYFTITKHFWETFCFSQPFPECWIFLSGLLGNGSGFHGWRNGGLGRVRDLPRVSWVIPQQSWDGNAEMRMFPMFLLWGFELSPWQVLLFHQVIYCTRAGQTRCEVCTHRDGQSRMFLEFRATFCLMLYLGILQYFLPMQKSVHIRESWIVQ